MRMTDSVFVKRDVAQVYRFFLDPQNLAKWDRSVADVVRTSEGPVEVGATFDTIGPASSGKAGLKTSYRVLRLEENRRMDVLVTSSNLFKDAVWEMAFEPREGGTLIRCATEFSLKLKYALFAPLLLLNKRAIARDLDYLRTEIERG